MSKRVNEGLFILALSVSLFLLLALLTYSHHDPLWLHNAKGHGIDNAGGRVGAFVADLLLFVFGYLAYLFPLILIYASWQIIRDHARNPDDYLVLGVRVVGLVLLLMGGCGLAYLEMPNSIWLPKSAGGSIGFGIASGLIGLFNASGTVLLLLAVLLIGITLLTGISWLKLLEVVGYGSYFIFKKSFGIMTLCNAKLHDYFERRRLARKPQKRVEPANFGPIVSSPSPAKVPPPKKLEEKPKNIEVTAPLVIAPKAKKPETSKRFEQQRQAPLFDTLTGETLPPLNLLDPPEHSTEKGYTNEQLEHMSREVEQRLLDFGVQVQVVAVHPGPVITRFELELAAGIKASKISALAKDLARSLSVISVRVVEVIPGKSVVGLELPNKYREMVRLSEVLSTQNYDDARSPLSLALGVDIAGHPVIVDLAKMPHLLVAGTTGSGKSVGLNAMLLSMLFKATPEEVRMILVDPKMLELSVYEGIPHLLTPVVTDMKEAANALRWSVGEMERRYRLMAALGVRNLAGYNAKVKEAEKKGEPLKDPLWKNSNDMSEEAPALQSLPYIVVLIDELADMMMVVGKKVEQLIARIAQKARAAGIHLILATQRPSVDVLTGLIKSNIPTRIAFQVSSKIDSRTILDQQGAEALLGHGDMLYLVPGAGTPMRVHGAFVDDKEVHRIANEWRKLGEPQYLDAITQSQGDAYDLGILGDSEGNTEDVDPLFDEAVRFVTETRKASISAVQRRLKIGYNRAARLIEEMERTGIVSPMESNGTREVVAPPPPSDD